ncbi:MAG: LysE family translocator [Kordiimonadaceae bacterium]|jgi:threonine/homoserine/homoserine lactone efflux protein|nr:LysE family translocator [Kordiimonadaceae bacterium]
MSIEFFITSIVVILLPGTGVLYTVAIGLGRGFRASIAAAIGCTAGIIPAALASIIGLAAIFHTSALAFQIVKYLGVLYMLYMAWNILRDVGALDVKQDRKPISLMRITINGALINFLNPKLSLFFLAFLPQFVEIGNANAPAQMFTLAGIFMVLTFIVFVGYGGCASLAHDYVINRPSVLKWLKRSFATTFAFLGVRLALSDR